MTAKEKLFRDVLDLDEAKATRARIVVVDEPELDSETVPLPELGPDGKRRTDARHRRCRSPLARKPLDRMLARLGRRAEMPVRIDQPPSLSDEAWRIALLRRDASRVVMDCLDDRGVATK